MDYRFFTLNKQDTIPLYRQLYQQIKEAIHTQNIGYNEKLTSKRKLAEYLHISQNTIETAYEQLMAEGYVQSQRRRGYFVCYQHNHIAHPIKIPPTPKVATSETQPIPYKINFNPNAIETEHFPFDVWKRKSKTLINRQHKQLLTLGENQGEWVLRCALAEYLKASRGLICQPEQIVLAAGIENCLMQLNLLFEQGTQPVKYAMEEYGYNTVADLFTALKKPLKRLPLHNNLHQIDLTDINKADINTLYLTPSHQYPYGEVLPINARQKLLDWVNQKDQRFIIEDDYDSEFRYKGDPIPTLQSLDTCGKVIYLGSLSKLLMPSIRVTFMVLPITLVQDYQQICGFFKSTVSRIDQHLIAKFINEGDFERHINRMRKIYHKKMILLCQLFKPYQDKIHYYGEYSGSYLLIELYTENRSLQTLVQLAQKEKIKLYPIAINNKKFFSMGFGHLSETEIEEGIKKLMVCWGY